MSGHHGRWEDPEAVVLGSADATADARPDQVHDLLLDRIGHPRGDRAAKVLALASSREVGFEIEAKQCSPASWTDPQRGRQYRQRYFRNHPRGLEGNP